MKKPNTIRAAELIEDLSLYPRNTIEDTHINDLVRALSSGAQLPPIVVERSTKRIADGVHRRRAWLKHDGEDAEVPVIFRDYENDAAFYLDAVAMNAGHGRRLDRHDQTRIVLRLQELGVDARTIAATLHVPEQDVRTLAVRVVYDTSGLAVPQKRGLEHMRGRTLNDNQLAAMKAVRSAEIGRLCLELTRLLDNDLVDYTDQQVHDRLRVLGVAVTAALLRCEEPVAQ